MINGMQCKAVIFAALLIGFAVALDGAANTAAAQAVCPTPIGGQNPDINNLQVPTAVNDFGNDCVQGATSDIGYNTIATSFLQVKVNLFLPDVLPVSGAANPARLAMDATPNSAPRDPITTLSCPGGTFGFIGGIARSITLPEGGQCALFAAAPVGNGGELVSLEGILRLNNGVYTFENGVITGAEFGGTVVLPAANGSESGSLGNQQAKLSNLVVTNSLRTLGDVLDGLGNGLNGYDEVEISANGFAASTTSVANWIHQNQRQKYERQLADLPRNENGDQTYVTPVASLMPARKPKWNAWIKGNWTYYDGDGSSFDGNTIDVLAGFDYKVDDQVILGLLGGYGNADFDTVTGGTSGAFEADGYTVGPYIGVKLSNNVQIDALAAYTYSDYDNRVGLTSGDFVAHRVTVGAQLKGTWQSDGFFIEPSARIMYAEEQQDAYTDSAGTRQSSLTIRAGRASVGPKVGFVHRTDDGMKIKTWVAVKGEYDFSNQGDVPASGLPDLDDVFSGRVSAGIDTSSDGGVGVSLQGDVSGLGSDEYLAYGGTARINVPF